MHTSYWGALGALYTIWESKHSLDLLPASLKQKQNGLFRCIYTTLLPQVLKIRFSFVLQVKDHSLYSLASHSSGMNEGGTADKTKDHGDQKGEEDEEEKPPQTAHAVLDEGSINCLALSRKGLFIAGKVLHV